MQDVRVYDHWGNLLLIVPQYIRLCWAEAFRTAGEVELTLTAPHKLYDLLEQNPYLLLKWNGQFATVTGFSCKENRLTVRAETLLTLLKRRIIPTDGLTLTGTPKGCVVSLLQSYAPFLQIKSYADDGEEGVFQIEKTLTLSDAANLCLKGTGVGMRIFFDQGVFYFEFVEKNEKYTRLSAGNRNAAAVRVSIPYDSVQTAGFYTEYFEPVVTLYDTGGIGDGNPDNYMKQYKAGADLVLNGSYYDKDTYLYCDTPDGKFKAAAEPQVLRVRYVSLTDNPLAVFEADLRHLEKSDAENTLALRRYYAEDWSVESAMAPYALGDVLKVEKTLGEVQGIKRVQVRKKVYDSALNACTLSFTQMES